MIRRTLKDKELQWMKSSEINGLTSDVEILLASANQGNCYFLGYDEGSIAVDIDTSICSQAHEKAYVESKMVNNEGLHLKLSKNYIYKDVITELKEIPTATVEGVILCNTYNNVTRYLGVNGTAICSTRDQNVAASDDRYYWNLEFYQTGRFKLHNPKSSRYIYYNRNTSPYYNTNTSSTNLYFKYVNNSGFTIANANTSAYYMRFNTDTALTRQQNTAQYWHIYIPRISPLPSDEGEPLSTSELSAMPTETVEDVLLYDGTRYLGLTTGNAVTSTTDLDAAMESKYYHWNLTYYSSNRFKIQNAQTTGRYIRYSNSAFSISTTNTNLYFAYNATNKFTIMGSNGSNWMYMSSNTALGRSTSARYWHIYKVNYRYPVEWKAPQTMKFAKLEPINISKVVAGYNENELMSITCDIKILCHGDSLNELYYYDTSQDYRSAWLIFDKSKYIIPRDEPVEPAIKMVGAKYYETESDTSWDIQYNYGAEQKFDLVITIGGTHGGMMLYYEDDSELTGSTINWDSLVITRVSGAEIEASSVSAVGWITDTTAYNGRHLTNGGNIGIGSRQDAETSETHPYAIGFTSGSSMSPAEELTFTFKGVTIE